MLSQYIDQIIFCVGGVVTAYIGYSGLIGTRVGDLMEPQKAMQMKKRFRTLGPMLIGVSLVMAAAKYFPA